MQNIIDKKIEDNWSDNNTQSSNYIHKKIKDKLFELRILGKIEVRIFYMFNKSKIILLHGFIKKSQKIPKKELRYALNKMNELDKV
mgnify:CR=1 FL=1